MSSPVCRYSLRSGETRPIKVSAIARKGTLVAQRWLASSKPIAHLKKMARWRADGLKSAKHKAAVAGEKLSAEKSRVRLSKKASATLARRREHLKVLRSHQPRVHFGTVASGSLVVASKTLQARLLTLHGKILGTEMESAGMMARPLLTKCRRRRLL